MKVVVGSLQQETNTFSPITSSINDFNISRGRDMLDNIAVTQFLNVEGVEILPTLYANALPSGMLKKSVFNKIANELVDRIPADIKIDGVWLYCHGALEVSGIGSGELELAKRIRGKIGFNIPISMALDFHANIDPCLSQYVNVICGYRTAPHTDIHDTQIRAAKNLLKCIRENILPVPFIIKIPMILSGDMVITAKPPMDEVINSALDAEKADPNILSLSVFNGQTWADVAHAGASVVLSAKTHDKRVIYECKNTAWKYWSARESFHFQVDALEPETAVEYAMYEAGGMKKPIFISDTGDNTTAGAMGHNSGLLKILLEKKAGKALVGGIMNKRITDIFYKMEIGGKHTFFVGDRLIEYDSNAKDCDEDHMDEFLRVRGVLKWKGDILGWDNENAGKAVVICINGIDAVITENRCAFISPEIFASAGIDIFDYKIIVVKLGYLYPELEKVKGKAIMALTDGASCVSVDKIDFKKIRKPMFPMNGTFEWKP
ncbi:MAG: M81 family metallopeptidase [Saccharofermentanales bacterium]